MLKKSGMGFAELSTSSNPLLYIRTHGHSKALWNQHAGDFPEYDAIVVAAENASSYEEMQRLVRKADMYWIKEHWVLFGVLPPVFHFWQPWLVGYNAETTLGGGTNHTIFSRLWIDQELKESMGH